MPAELAEYDFCVSVDPSQFYTGLVAQAYAPLRGSVYPSEPYVRFVKRWGQPGLEIGCGHGEPLLDLVAEGLDVVGLDSSNDMLELARKEAARRGLKVELRCEPMELMDLGRQFASIYFAGPTFQLVIDPALAARALGRIAAHLLPEGRALIPLFTPQPIDPDALGVWKEHSSEDDVLAFRTVSQSYRAHERRVDSLLEYRRGPAGAPTELVERTWSLRWYNADEFETLAAAAGLRIDSRTGSSFVLANSSVATLPSQEGL
jgi:SAM-dependent methyltransferase